jgi:acetoin utilization deacetylase AcuC-like enzyme
MDSRPLVIRDRRFREHRSRSVHPERPERLDAVDAALAPLADRIRDIEPRAATPDEILRVHSREHLDRLRSIEGAEAQIDADTYAAPRSLEVARLAAGSAIDLALAVARREAPSGFALVRPPGHHAEPSTAMGFCLLNNVAIAAEALRAQAGVERIAIVDWDVHHGNGTQRRFEADGNVLFLSTHQFPLYPGTGAVCETGQGAGAGTTLNLPLPAGCGDDEYEAVFDAVLVPVLREFRPEIVLVSAGFDAHADDPLASMEVTTEGFRALAARVRDVAEDLCGGRLVLTLEGGYDLDALGASVAAVTEVLAVSRDSIPLSPTEKRPESRAERLAAAFREVHSRHWQALGSPGST